MKNWHDIANEKWEGSGGEMINEILCDNRAIMYIERGDGCDSQQEFEKRLKMTLNAPQLFMALLEAHNQLKAVSQALFRQNYDEATLHAISRDHFRERLLSQAADDKIFKDNVNE